MHGLGFAVGEPAPGVPVASPGPTGEALLQQHVNRFAGPSAPAALRVRATPLPVTGVIDDATAIAAIVIAQRRAADALATYSDKASTDVLRDALVALANPVPFVRSHLPDMITIVSNYANAKGLPGPADSTTVLGMKKSTLIVAGLVVGALLFLKGR
jgi:hypothetical protein